VQRAMVLPVCFSPPVLFFTALRWVSQDLRRRDPEFCRNIDRKHGNTTSICPSLSVACDFNCHCLRLRGVKRGERPSDARLRADTAATAEKMPLWRVKYAFFLPSGGSKSWRIRKAISMLVLEQRRRKSDHHLSHLHIPLSISLVLRQARVAAEYTDHVMTAGSGDGTTQVGDTRRGGGGGRGGDGSTCRVRLSTATKLNECISVVSCVKSAAILDTSPASSAKSSPRTRLSGFRVNVSWKYTPHIVLTREATKTSGAAHALPRP